MYYFCLLNVIVNLYVYRFGSLLDWSGVDYKGSYWCLILAATWLGLAWKEKKDADSNGD